MLLKEDVNFLEHPLWIVSQRSSLNSLKITGILPSNFSSKPVRPIWDSIFLKAFIQNLNLEAW